MFAMHTASRVLAGQRLPQPDDCHYRRHHPHDDAPDPFADPSDCAKESFAHLDYLQQFVRRLVVSVELALDAVHAGLTFGKVREDRVHRRLNIQQLEASFGCVPVCPALTLTAFFWDDWCAVCCHVDLL